MPITERLFAPDRYFAGIQFIDIEFDLKRKGLDHVLLDIDNTIRSRETHDIPRSVQAWLAKARSAGIEFCLLSNNWHASARQFAESLDLPIVAKACKPIPFSYLRAMSKISGVRRDTVCVGDQLLTDVLGAHLCGMKAYMVLPLAQTDLRHTLALRGLERVLMGNIHPEGAYMAPTQEG